MMSARWRPFWSATAHATSPAILLLSIAAPMFWGEGTVLARLVLIVQESCTIEFLSQRPLSFPPAGRTPGTGLPPRLPGARPRRLPAPSAQNDNQRAQKLAISLAVL